MHFDIPIDKLATSSHIHLDTGFSSGTEVFKDMFHIASQGETKLQKIRNASVGTYSRALFLRNARSCNAVVTEKN